MKTAFPYGRRAAQANSRAATSKRRGGMLVYCMIYVLLAGIITASAGTMLHLMFQTRKADAKRADGIRQLLRIDRQLRTDWESVSEFDAAGQTFTVKTTDQTAITYVVESNVVQRIVKSQTDEVLATDRFQFSKGAMLEFETSGQPDGGQPDGEQPDGQASGVVLRLTSPVLRQKKAIVDTESITGQQVEIYLALPSQDTATGTDVATDKEPS